VSHTALASLRSFADLTKPRLLPLVLLTGIPAFLLATGATPSLGYSFLVLLGIALAAASANTFNSWIERDKDALMERTRRRPLPAGRVAPGAALAFGLALALASAALLYAVAGRLAAGLGVASILFYVFVYTVWLKPRSAAWNAVIGGAAGAAAPLIADAAVNGSVGPVGLALFAIVFFWQPPHVWAIALYRKADYAAAGIPMLPAAIGDQATRRRVLWYTLGLVPVSLAPLALGLGGLYLAVALVANAGFVGSALLLLRERSDAAARRVFRVSLLYLFALFVAMNAELLLRG
jgi:protoheme IX farnesyltransferase